MDEIEEWREMRCRTPRIAIVVVSVILAACESDASPTAHAMSDSPSIASATQTPAVPNPFRIIARYSATSLGLKNPQHFAIGPDGNLYVAESIDRISVISPDGKVLDRWGESGSRPGEISFLIDDPSQVLSRITVGPDGLVYLSDSGNARVEVFEPDGRFIRQFGSFGSGNGQFQSIGDLAVDDEGNVYAAEDERGLLSKFSPDGRFLWRVGGPESDLFEPHLGSIDVHGRLLLLNGLGTVLYVDRNGQTVDQFQAAGCDVSIDRLGFVYVNRNVDGCDPGLTQVFDRRHRLIGEWSGPDDTFSSPILFGQHGEAFVLSNWKPNGTGAAILRLEISLPGE